MVNAQDAEAEEKGDKAVDDEAEKMIAEAEDRVANAWEIFVRVQTFRRVPPVLPCNFCHPGANEKVPFNLPTLIPGHPLPSL